MNLDGIITIGSIVINLHNVTTLFMSDPHANYGCLLEIFYIEISVDMLECDIYLCLHF